MHTAFPFLPNKPQFIEIFKMNLQIWKVTQLHVKWLFTKFINLFITKISNLSTTHYQSWFISNKLFKIV